ncbi:carbamoyl-phosphate synthase large subunit [Mycoplasma sp. SG1]|uniref:carbamoyl-phosphate synthase large subunit n=1 Tax=Mycoplasma sp. SG1 TaxID=2810348 RepID=UPI002023E276|nr:carbamoyl-phosphate synthase large subunit [Mycoplasma sp. SG1]URM52822.1 carbamoyl-phosphate synthase large subunit [Mycoplasma sp. SG1]
MKRKDIKKILVIGSGPIMIGQGAEFDYSGTQACLSLLEEGYEVILINPNPSTIMTDEKITTRVYFEPLTVTFVEEVLNKEKPDAILGGFGGQIALNLLIKLKDKKILDKHNIEVIGVSTDVVKLSENRHQFCQFLESINVPFLRSKIVSNLKDGLSWLKVIKLPVIIRPSFTLGGLGSGICKTKEEFIKTIEQALKLSPINEVLIEPVIYGFKEIEYEVIRDKSGQIVTICNMENIDPVGIHTGDSCVVCPSLTLTNDMYQRLRTTAHKIISNLKLIGGCNVQFAVNPDDNQIYVIEINPRVSRSSALASKASGYPIAWVCAKLAVGYNLSEIYINPKNGKIKASFEPSFDYIVVKFPQFPFDKFKTKDQHINTQMQATGEAMAIGLNFCEAFLKAIRSINLKYLDFNLEHLKNTSTSELLKLIKTPNGEWYFQIYQLLKRKISCQTIWKKTKIDLFWLHQFKKIAEIEHKLEQNHFNQKYFILAKKHGLSDDWISKLWNVSIEDIFQYRHQEKIHPVYKSIDSCAAEFKFKSSYLYSTYNGLENDYKPKKDSIFIIGSGPIKIGQGVEFDYATVHSVLSLEKVYQKPVIIINNNPETLSTDFRMLNQIFFEPITYEDVMNIFNLSAPHGVLLQFGGQTAISLINNLAKTNINILGSSNDIVNISEDRVEFAKFLSDNNIPHPKNLTAYSHKEAYLNAGKIGYPVVIRPSYVIGGEAMQIIYSATMLIDSLKTYKISHDKPLYLDSYLQGTEVEVDLVSDGVDIFIPGLMEHIETAGVHSGDSTVFFPSTLKKEFKDKILKAGKTICRKLKIIGLVNIQFIIFKDQVYVLEINVRSSRSIPYISKITKTNIIDLAIKIIIEKKTLKELGYTNYFDFHQNDEKRRIFVKVPTFSFNKLTKVTSLLLGPEMKSTGEAMAIDHTFDKALYKALLASNIDILKHRTVILSCHRNTQDREKLIQIAKNLLSVGYTIFSTPGTNKFLKLHDLDTIQINKLKKKSEILDLIYQQKVSFIVNIASSESWERNKDIKIIQEEAISREIMVFTSINLALVISNLCLKMKYLISNL